MMIGVQSVIFIIQGSMREGISFSGGSTGVEFIAMVTILIVRVEAGLSFLFPSVSVELFVRLIFFLIFDCRRELVSLQESLSQKRGWMIIEWRFISEEETIMSL